MDFGAMPACLSFGIDICTRRRRKARETVFVLLGKPGKPKFPSVNEFLYPRGNAISRGETALGDLVVFQDSQGSISTLHESWSKTKGGLLFPASPHEPLRYFISTQQTIGKRAMPALRPTKAWPWTSATARAFQKTFLYPMKQDRRILFRVMNLKDFQIPPPRRAWDGHRLSCSMLLCDYLEKRGLR